ncbi:MAG: hypothetical protein ACLFS7_04585 [Desulfosudaceae bacterium]
MIIDMNDFEIDLEVLVEAFSQMIKDIGLDETDDEQVYNTITVFLASLIAEGLKEAYQDDPDMLEEQIKTTCKDIADDLEQKIRALIE